MNVRNTLAALATLTTIVGCQGPAVHEDSTRAAVSSNPSIFIKDGNNGTVDCATYCSGAGWGTTGGCEGSLINDIPCDQTIGYLANGTEETCVCADGNGAPFVKHGDNGTASCAISAPARSGARSAPA